MKTAALIVLLLTQPTGLMARLPMPIRTGLTNFADPAPAAALTAAPNVALPVQTGTEPLQVNAASALAVDTATGTVLYAQNANSQRPIASITKLVTALVVLSGHKLTDQIKIPKLPTYQTGDQLAGLIPGETYTVGALVQAALIYSADDAADALGIAISGSTSKFAALMNAKMTEWGITGTHFSNPSGLQDNGNYATAAALGNIAGLSLANPFIRQTVGLQQATVTSTTGRVLVLPTTDDLLASGQFYGIKTGYTPAAGECFVGLTRINGHEVITVVLGAGDRFAATTTLTAWIGRNWQWY